MNVSMPTTPPGRALPRRGFLLSAAGAATALVAGCSNSSAKTAATAAPKQGFPVTIPGKLGPTKVANAPARVVACGYLRDTDLALALGANLVGFGRNSTFPTGLAPWQKASSQAKGFDTVNGLPLTTIDRLRPDLILASDDYGLAKDWATLGKIAPTLGYLKGVGEDSWQQMATRAGAALGKKDKAAALVTEVEQKIATVKSRHPEFAGKTFTFGPVEGNGQIFTTSSATDASATFFRQLGFTLAPAVTQLPASATPGRSEISMERLDLLDADVLILAYQTTAAQKKLEANPLFKRLKAVERGSYIPLDFPTAIALAFPSVLSIPFGLDATVPKLATAVAKS
ncbi:ABC transporter substrate-binding protein [Streptomyces sp. CA-111067]|uniref:ABC transporter substrate-binding protein n=1 Tax=Streptomyces sp. CA-111067 TaxID=3240046 RepID=UPI003D9836B1